jgi:competence protein ComFC
MSIFSLLMQEIFGYAPKVTPIPPKPPISPKNFVTWYKGVGMPKEVVSVWVLFEYQDVSQILKRWKYEGNENSKIALEQAFGKALRIIPSVSKRAAASYVPLGPDRWYERGFNQSKHLSSIVYNEFWTPVFHGLYRLWSGQHQAWISKDERMDRNFSFGIIPFFKVPEEVILVDDVISTWSTLRACAQLLVKRGCKKVYIIALARSA